MGTDTFLNSSKWQECRNEYFTARDLKVTPEEAKVCINFAKTHDARMIRVTPKEAKEYLGFAKKEGIRFRQAQKIIDTAKKLKVTRVEANRILNHIEKHGGRSLASPR